MSAPTVKFVTSPHILFVENLAYCTVEIDAGDVNGLDLPMSTIEAFDGVRWVDGLMQQINEHTTRCTISWHMAGVSETQTKFWLTNASGESSEWISSDNCIYPHLDSFEEIGVFGVGVGIAVVAALYLYLTSKDL